jgi:hypothetical protein
MASDAALITADATVATFAVASRVVPAGVTNSVQVLATGSSATPGILEHGDGGRIPVYYLGYAVDHHQVGVGFSLASLTADDITWSTISLGGVLPAGSDGGSGSGGGTSGEN